MISAMYREIYRSLHIIITEAWTVVWDEDSPPPAAEADSHLIVWEEGQPGPESVVLRRSGDKSGWHVMAYNTTE